MEQDVPVTLSLSTAHINVIINGLGELPAKVSLATIDEVRRQLNAPAAPAVPVAPSVSVADITPPDVPEPTVA